MTEYIVFDFINDNQIKEKYDSFEDLVKCTNEFYHDTFQNEEGYDENRKYITLDECIEIWEGSGFGVAEVLICKGEQENDNE